VRRTAYNPHITDFAVIKEQGKIGAVDFGAAEAARAMMRTSSAGIVANGAEAQLSVGEAVS
jgi:hypothetical protein